MSGTESTPPGRTPKSIAARIFEKPLSQYGISVSKNDAWLRQAGITDLSSLYEVLEKMLIPNARQMVEEMKLDGIDEPSYPAELQALTKLRELFQNARDEKYLPHEAIHEAAANLQRQRGIDIKKLQFSLRNYGTADKSAQGSNALSRMLNALEKTKLFKEKKTFKDMELGRQLSEDSMHDSLFGAQVNQELYSALQDLAATRDITLPALPPLPELPPLPSPSR